MSFTGAVINKLDGGLGRSSSNDRVIVLAMGMTLVGDLAFNKAVELLDIKTVESLGITVSTDDTASELVHYHLSEMFRLAPESTFYLIPVDKTKTVSALVADAAFKAALRGIKDRNVLAIGGLSTPVSSALVDAVAFESLVTSLASEFILLDGIFVEGVGAADPITASAYPDMRSITAPHVTYVIAQDPSVASLKTGYAKRAAIGTVLGSVAARKVHEDIGSVDIEEKPRARKGAENYSLTSETMGYWLSAALSDGKAFSTLTPAEQKSLTAKGYMYVGSFPDYAGFYFNGCPTSVAKTSDYSYFNNNCIWNKAARIIRNTLIPRVRSKVPTEPSTGFIKSTWITDAEGLVLKKLEAMITAGNIDDADVYIDPAQIIGEDAPLSIKCQIVKGQIVHEFDVDLGFTTQID